jgi:hypothetical protein
MRTVRVAIAAAAMLALAGCATTVEEEEAPGVAAEEPKPPVVERPKPPAKVAVAPPVAPAPPATPPAPPALQVSRASEVDALLAEFERLRRLPAAELAREQEAARQAYNQSRSDGSRVRLAMAMTVPGIPGSEDLRALELLDPLVKNVTAPLHGLAFLMSAYIQEQRRLASQVQGLQQNAQGLQQNVQALQQKLDALRTLERSLSEREAGTPRKR